MLFFVPLFMPTGNSKRFVFWVFKIITNYNYVSNLKK